MRRKVVPVTPKMLSRSDLDCSTCIRWEGVESSAVNTTDCRRRIKQENMRRIIKAWGECGKIVYVDNEAVAYAQYGPAEFWQGAKCFPSSPVSEDAIFLACLYVLPFAQGRGLGRVLLQSVEAGLARRKVKAIETFVTRKDQHPPGPIEFYLQNGFYIIKDDSHFPLLRLELKALVSWQVNIQFNLNSLKVPARASIGTATSTA